MESRFFLSNCVTHSRSVTFILSLSLLLRKMEEQEEIAPEILLPPSRKNFSSSIHFPTKTKAAGKEMREKKNKKGNGGS